MSQAYNWDNPSYKVTLVYQAEFITHEVTFKFIGHGVFTEGLEYGVYRKEGTGSIMDTKGRIDEMHAQINKLLTEGYHYQDLNNRL